MDVERRREPRIQAYQTVELTVLGDNGHSMPAQAIQLSKRGMRLVLDRPVVVNSPVKVVIDDWMVLGEVCYCKFERSHYAVGLSLDQALMGVHHLSTSLSHLHETEKLLA